MKNLLLLIIFALYNSSVFSKENNIDSATAIATAKVIKLVTIKENTQDINKELATIKTISKENGLKQVTINFE